MKHLCAWAQIIMAPVVSRTEEQRYLSYNFRPHYVGRTDIGWLFEEAYLF